MDILLNSEIKKSYKKEICLILLIILFMFFLNYKFLDNFLIKFFSDEQYLITEKECFISRIVDGDTVIACGNSTRLLGINTPEKTDKFYQEAKDYTTSKVLNKTVKLVFSNERTDLYGRTLAYVFYKNNSLNQELIENGLANAYFPVAKDEYYTSFLDSWKNCIKKNKNLCEKSKTSCTNCISLEKFDFINEEIILKNNCNFKCDLTKWTIKDEGRKVFVFPKFTLDKFQELNILVSKNKSSSENTLIWKRTDYVWTDSGDTMFLRDNEGKLVLWKNY